MPRPSCKKTKDGKTSKYKEHNRVEDTEGLPDFCLNAIFINFPEKRNSMSKIGNRFLSFSKLVENVSLVHKNTSPSRLKSWETGRIPCLQGPPLSACPVKNMVALLTMMVMDVFVSSSLISISMSCREYGGVVDHDGDGYLNIIIINFNQHVLMYPHH